MRWNIFLASWNAEVECWEGLVPVNDEVELREAKSIFATKLLSNCQTLRLEREQISDIAAGDLRGCIAREYWSHEKQAWVNCYGCDSGPKKETCANCEDGRGCWVCDY